MMSYIEKENDFLLRLLRRGQSFPYKVLDIL